MQIEGRIIFQFNGIMQNEWLFCELVRQLSGLSFNFDYHLIISGKNLQFENGYDTRSFRKIAGVNGCWNEIGNEREAGEKADILTDSKFIKTTKNGKKRLQYQLINLLSGATT
ncbi:hypothetical protein [Dyadobacter bucti]|jgi:hypothetical protein|uniref:hypothetical protein n=1 Tax=Dyadobacter bucti TaxID=2572203 RepID=UPI001108A228|nr:hypothetical protein [Dyadobacter bucti]